MIDGWPALDAGFHFQSLYPVLLDLKVLNY